VNDGLVIAAVRPVASSTRTSTVPVGPSGTTALIVP
jgi:hypothetical protein